ncbi:unnamed protein product [Caenorhabditis angaria]|uniref:Tyrosine-protein phosphatase domain-containing protein n=1 Tax=Caenorhabditis angaria TaxID=860376 RepID=A0A9P1IDB0_9PELO|nr:unnamed protein product [Caenorhabditis angaria]
MHNNINGPQKKRAGKVMNGLSEEGTNRKERKEKKTGAGGGGGGEKGGIMRRLGFVLNNDKSEQGSTLRKKKKKNKVRKSASQVIRDTKVHFVFQKPHAQIPLKGDKITDLQKSVFHKFAQENVKRGPLELSSDFLTKIKPYVGHPLKREVFDANHTKNRYKDVICNDITRVVINDGKDDDYIHANWVNGLNSPFILTLDRTVIDFWRMIVHTKTTYIVMLCDVTEDGKPKCYQYWPDKPGQSVTHGEFTITCKNEEDKDEHVIKSILTIKNKGGDVEHTLRHLHTKTCTGPVCVHCSAGIGRTGTFVCIEACLQTLTDEKELDIVATVKALRNSRLGSVQVDVQYMTLVQVVLNYGKDNGFWDDSDIDDRIELLTWNISQFVSTRAPVKSAAEIAKEKEKREEKEKEEKKEKEKEKEREKEREKKKEYSKEESDDEEGKEDKELAKEKEIKKEQKAVHSPHVGTEDGNGKDLMTVTATATVLSKDPLVLSPAKVEKCVTHGNNNNTENPASIVATALPTPPPPKKIEQVMEQSQYLG